MTHGRERLVARCVQEHDALSVVVDLRCTDVLGDATTLAGSDLGRTERVEQAGLAVVDVAHDLGTGREPDAELEDAHARHTRRDEVAELVDHDERTEDEEEQEYRDDRLDDVHQAIPPMDPFA